MAETDEQIAARVAAFQDAIMVALKNTPRVPVHVADAAREAELQRMADYATGIGVDPQEYRRWAAGEHLQHITDAVKKCS